MRSIRGRKTAKLNISSTREADQTRTFLFKRDTPKEIGFIKENTENAFEWLCTDAEATFNRGNIRKRHFLSLEMRSREGSWSSQGKH
ncbi:hypothetical protein G5714_008072 [Onychostoma macrolepis]|uniref:Uncharacterized protein n=1 Tax=Onychostoma macrolepis TaxID=369639 RepID=A0A7J6CVA6_9TELE|nr:hypothetical protein G5714_008072 [Onychostoma macrolepis]